MRLDRSRIEQLVPHAGAMCLLDGVTQWDAGSIACHAAAPAAGHALLRDGMLPAVAGCEYAAQAAAVHGALLDGAGKPKAGMLAKLMEVDLHRPCFAQDAGTLAVRAALVSRMDAGCLYEFEIAQAGQPVVSGRLIVAFGSPGSP
jgi:predicted hotdog family 3-hydroxylacyl-ACP dehydratase